MDDAMKAAYINAQTACMLSELEGMKVANRDREQNNLAPAYNEKDFMDLPLRFDLHHNAVISFFTR